MPITTDPTPSVVANGLHRSVDSAMSALGGLDSQGFLNLLVAQLRYQSPLEPRDPGDLMSQTAALAQLDATQQLLVAQQQQFGLQEVLVATGLLGTTVTAHAEDGSTVTGIVDAVRYTPLGPVLRIGEHELPLFAVSSAARDGAPPPVDPPPGTDPEADPPTEPPSTPPIDDPDAGDGV